MKEGQNNHLKPVYEDNWLYVLNKPAGILTTPVFKGQDISLTSILSSTLERNGILYRLHPCHRLDKETSGLIIYAKGKSAQRRMMQQFKEKKIRKTYIAFVRGEFKNNNGNIKIPINKEDAFTKYRVLKKGRYFSVVEIMPITGRKNQIRIHFSKIGHPVVGERKFAFGKDFKIRASRLCLHAISLEFTHPYTHKMIKVCSTLPLSMKNFLLKHNL